MKGKADKKCGDHAQKRGSGSNPEIKVKTIRQNFLSVR
jgi:hypothetical protein